MTAQAEIDLGNVRHVDFFVRHIFQLFQIGDLHGREWRRIVMINDQLYGMFFAHFPAFLALPQPDGNGRSRIMINHKNTNAQIHIYVFARLRHCDLSCLHILKSPRPRHIRSRVRSP